jgi:N-acyl-L-homoserine lactone synthetase
VQALDKEVVEATGPELLANVLAEYIKDVKPERSTVFNSTVFKVKPKMSLQCCNKY